MTTMEISPPSNSHPVEAQATGTELRARSAKDVIDEAIRENQKWELLVFSMTVAVGVAGMAATVVGVIRIDWGILTVGLLISAILDTQLIRLTIKFRDSNMRLRMLELPLSRAISSDEVIDLLHDIFPALPGGKSPAMKPDAARPDIPPRDYSPITVSRIVNDGISLAVDPPLVLVPKPDPEDGSLIIVEDEEMNLFVGSDTREKLLDEVKSHLAFMWREYASEDPEKLTDDAKILRNTLRNRMRDENAP